MAGNVRLHSTNSRKFCPHQIPEAVIREGMERYKCPISRTDQLFSGIMVPFIQYLFGIKSMRQTIKDIEVNVAYRWFLGLDLRDPCLKQENLNGYQLQ